MNKNMEDKWINTDEVAEYLGVKATTIREWIKKNNGIPAHKIGRQWKFKKEELFLLNLSIVKLIFWRWFPKKITLDIIWI